MGFRRFLRIKQYSGTKLFSDRENKNFVRSLPLAVGHKSTGRFLINFELFNLQQEQILQLIAENFVGKWECIGRVGDWQLHVKQLGFYSLFSLCITSIGKMALDRRFLIKNFI